MRKLIKKIVCFGGGSVVPKLLLAELKKYPLKITGVTSMVDNGGSTGQLRRDFNVLPPGDIRRHIIALADAPEWKKELFKFRFGQEEFDGGHKGHNFANVFLAGLEHTLKDYQRTLRIVHDFMEIKNHQALPATIDKVQLMAELENGEIIEGEDEIDVPKIHNPDLKIKGVFLKPEAKIFLETKIAIEEADLITFGPGDLYSSVIPCLLPKGMGEALRESGAKKVLICNLMTKIGETEGFSVADFADEVEKYMGCPLDFAVYNTKIPDKKRIDDYKKEMPLIADLVKVDPSIRSKQAGKKFIGKNLLVNFGPILHDSKKIARVLMKI